jgi:hypothetical protein
LIDYQPAMYQGVQSHDRIVVFNNVQILAKAAKLACGDLSMKAHNRAMDRVVQAGRSTMS